MNIRGALNWLNRRENKIIPKISPTFKFLFLAILIFGSSVLITKIKAAEETQENILEAKQDAVDAGSNNERWTHESIASQITVFINALLGKIPKGIFKGTQTSFVPGGMIGSANQMIASLYTPPASGIQYIAQLKDNLLGKPAYAQGIGVGFNGLQPILPIWRGFRNVVYIISSFLFVLIGIMIMLRVKISPQAVITIQSAIPQVIITLLLVTFSYAIAGLLIDASIFLQSLGIAILYQATGKNSLNDSLLIESILGGLGRWLGLPGWSFPTLANASLSTTGDLMLRMAPTASIAMLGMIVGAIVSGPAFLVGGAIGGILMILVLCIFVAMWQIKFYFGLIKCYVTVIIKIILAPLEIGLGAFPNTKIGFSSWILDLIANLSVFPISILFLILVNLIIDRTSQFGLWQPRLIEAGGLIGVIIKTVALPAGGLLPVAIGISGLLLLSKLPEMIPQFIFMLKPSPWGTAIGQGIDDTPIIGGVYKNTKASANKAIGDGTLKGIVAVANMAGIGAKQPKNPEHPGT